MLRYPPAQTDVDIAVHPSVASAVVLAGNMLRAEANVNPMQGLSVANSERARSSLTKPPTINCSSRGALGRDRINAATMASTATWTASIQGLTSSSMLKPSTATIAIMALRFAVREITPCVRQSRMAGPNLG